MGKAPEAGPSRQLRTRRVHHLRSRGLTWEQMAEVWIADYPSVSSRIAFRWAHNLSHQDVAERWNGISPGMPTITKARIYEFEAWPNGGRRPSVANLEMIARIYQTTAHALLNSNEYTLYDENSRTRLERIDFRSLDENLRIGVPSIPTADSSPITLISRPKIVHPMDGKEMLLVGGGSFPMGEERTPVDVPGFYIDVTPVTNDEYGKFVADTAHRAPVHWHNGVCSAALMSHPVTNVNYHDAVSYATWAGKRLPTAQEWEKAARGEAGFIYPWGDRPSIAKCNVHESGIYMTTPVGRYRSGISPYGVHDMSGNVWEWCASETSSGRFVLRGSAFTSPFEAARAAAMNDAIADMLDDDAGFRCVCSDEMMRTSVRTL